MQDLEDELKNNYGNSLHVNILQLDVNDRPAVESAVNQLPPSWYSIDLLIKNAGLSRGLDKLHEGEFQDWEEMIDTKY